MMEVSDSEQSLSESESVDEKEEDDCLLKFNVVSPEPDFTFAR